MALRQRKNTWYFILATSHNISHFPGEHSTTRKLSFQISNARISFLKLRINQSKFTALSRFYLKCHHSDSEGERRFNPAPTPSLVHPKANAFTSPSTHNTKNSFFSKVLGVSQPILKSNRCYWAHCINNSVLSILYHCREKICPFLGDFFF